MLTRNEIFAQYAALRKTIQKMEEKTGQLMERVPEKETIFVGCGSSYMICCALRDQAFVSLGIPVFAIPAGDLMLDPDRYLSSLEKPLLVYISRSGQTTEMLACAETIRKKYPDMRSLSIVCTENSPLEQKTDVTLTLPWAFDESVCQTKCVSNLYAAGELLIGLWRGDGKAAEGFSRLAEAGSGFLEKIDPVMKTIAQKNIWSNAAVLADGTGAGLFQEGALAFNEIAQVPSVYYHLLDSRHGPVVLFGKETLVIVKIRFPKGKAEQDFLSDIRKKGCTVVCFSEEETDLHASETFYPVALGEQVGPEAAAVAFLNICQLIAFYKSTVTGCDPDRPTGLNAWIRLDI